MLRIRRAGELRDEVIQINRAMRDHAHAEIDDDKDKGENPHGEGRQGEENAEQPQPQARPAATAGLACLIPGGDVEDAVSEEIDAKYDDANDERLVEEEPEGEAKQEREEAAHDIEDPRAAQHPRVEALHGKNLCMCAHRGARRITSGASTKHRGACSL
jgi:hypothetical protein